MKTLLIQKVHDTEFEGYRINEDYVEFRVFIDGKPVVTTGDHDTHGYDFVQGIEWCFKHCFPDHSVVWETIEEEGLI